MFIALIQMATSVIELDINDVMYRQFDGVFMGFLGPEPANSFVSNFEGKLLKRVSKLFMYFRYVDDTFSVFHNQEQRNKFLTHLNTLHPVTD